MRRDRVDRLEVLIFPDRAALGAAAGVDVAARMRELLARQAGVRMVFAAAPSQNEFLAALAGATAIDWGRVTTFQMDDYVGLGPDAPASFGWFLRQRLFDQVRPGTVHLIDGTADPAGECARYGGLLTAAPVDIVCLGIGENGHLAFNDPPAANFVDPEVMKSVALDLASRRQQVHDGCFPALGAVPARALTLTIPALLAGRRLSCVVPGSAKAAAVRAALRGPVTAGCPASILRTHEDCALYVDEDAYGGEGRQE